MIKLSAVITFSFISFTFSLCPAFAQYRQTCSSDLIGGFNCRDNNGGRIQIQNDMLGGYTIRNKNSGQRCTVQSDIMGGHRTRCR